MLFLLTSLFNSLIFYFQYIRYRILFVLPKCFNSIPIFIAPLSVLTSWPGIREWKRNVSTLLWCLFPILLNCLAQILLLLRLAFLTRPLSLRCFLYIAVWSKGSSLPISVLTLICYRLASILRVLLFLGL